MCESWLSLVCLTVQVLYAAALIPIGLLADRVNRPRLLAGGLVLWSLLTMTGSKVSLHVTSVCGQESSWAKLVTSLPCALSTCISLACCIRAGLQEGLDGYTTEPT